MKDAQKIRTKTVLLSFRFLGPALVGSLVMALVSAFAQLEVQIAVLGGYISILAGLFLSYIEQNTEGEKQRDQVLEKLSVPMVLSRDPELFGQYSSYCEVLTDLADMTDPILRETAILKLASVNAQLSPLSGGTVVFSGTESWRTVYEKLLASPELKEYRSVAYVRTKDYWQDAPGRQSMKANFDTVLRGIRIERIIILRDAVWPTDSLLPLDDILPWIDDQHNHGIWVVLIREDDLLNEPDLRADFGIYGDRAVGTQELDERSRTVRFTLSFDPSEIRLSNDRWHRLYLFATPYQTLLDRSSKNA
jgi:hypothetical protein